MSKTDFSIQLGIVMLLLFFLSLTLSFHEIAQKPIEDLVLLDNQQVSIKGFVHKTDSGLYILADEPTLKSCCKGSERLSNRQIWFDGGQAANYEGQLVSVEGVLAIVDTGSVRKMTLHHYAIQEPKALISLQNALIILSVVLLILWIIFSQRYSR